MTIYHQTDLVTLYQGDCLEVMPQLEARSFDCILADLPYGKTQCKWDSVIPFEPLWEQYKRLIKQNGAIVLFGIQPFTTDLIMSNREWFKYCWVWEKDNPSNFGNCQYMPMKYHEDIVVFGKKTIQFNPQMRDVGKVSNVGGFKTSSLVSFKTPVKSIPQNTTTFRYPSTILRFDRPKHNSSDQQIHPTQKPIALLEYLIRTYTNEGDMILDNTCGSGSLLVAARNTNRRAVGIDMDEGYCRVAAGRLGRFEPSEFEVDKKAVDGQLGLFGAIA